MRIASLFFFLLFAAFPAFSEILSKQGEGFLEKQNHQQILHLKGTPYERGYQHGVLLKDQIARNIATYIDQPKSPVPGRVEEFVNALPVLMSYVPAHFIEEMKGMAEGSGIPFSKIAFLNLFPEMFHCSGITVSGQASKNGELYHVRVLDYSVGKNLQNTSVLQIVEPENGLAFLNVSYAGFIGTITGMNREKIAIGEIGGLGYGSWQGIPMAFLLREILQKATSLSEVKAILQTSPRTCEYYYVFSDGKTNESFGVYATADQLQFITPGDSYALIAPSHLPANYGHNGDHDKFVLTSCTVENTAYQTLLFENDHRLAMLFRLQPPHCLLLTGYPYPERYPVLIERTLEKYGTIDEKDLMEIVKCPVARPSNLHTAIFQPSQLKVWIAHAGPNDEPACDQAYQEWDFSSLLSESSRG
jgi:isopenicillin-N N-acyltransferase like protein